MRGKSVLRAVRCAIAVVLVLASPSTAATEPRRGHVSVDDVEIYWEEHGASTSAPLLLLHGFGESTAVWSPHVDALSQGRRVVLVDLRGHGRSTNPRDVFTFSRSADDVLAVMDHLGHQRFDAVGVSGGGLALLHIATRRPERLQRLVLVGTAAYLPAQARERIVAIAADEPGTLAYLNQFATRGDEQSRMLLRQFRGLATGVDDPSFTPPELAAITAPTLIVHGDRDEFFPVEGALAMYRAIPRSYLLVYPNGGHEPIYDPAIVSSFVGALDTFLGGTWDPPAQ